MIDKSCNNNCEKKGMYIQGRLQRGGCEGATPPPPHLSGYIVGKKEKRGRGQREGKGKKRKKRKGKEKKERKRKERKEKKERQKRKRGRRGKKGKERKERKGRRKEKQKKRGVKRGERGEVRTWEKRSGSKREKGVVGCSRLVEGARKTRVNMLLCRVSCVDVLARSSCTISIQKFEVGEMYIVGRPKSFFPYELWLFIRCDDFKSD